MIRGVGAEVSATLADTARRATAARQQRKLPVSTRRKIETFDANGVITGWAVDSDIGDSVGVYFGVNGDDQSGLFAGATEANIPRPDLGYQEPTYGPRGFAFNIPQESRDGQPHTLYAGVRNTCANSILLKSLLTDPTPGFTLTQ